MSAGHPVICHNPIYNVLLNKDLEKDGLVQCYYVDGLTKKLAFIWKSNAKFLDRYFCFNMSNVLLKFKVLNSGVLSLSILSLTIHCLYLFELNLLLSSKI